MTESAPRRGSGIQGAPRPHTRPWNEGTRRSENTRASFRACGGDHPGVRPIGQLNRYFINDEEALVREMDARYWISGHTHMPHQASVGWTVNIGNPTGYRNEERGPGFRPDRVIDVESAHAAAAKVARAAAAHVPLDAALDEIDSSSA